ncbi:2-oxoglutarate-dependent dioxygenase dao [Phtheirospermum japonicum]|uniref:2-oxoglutarate-dependent dioxygenase dao n=1 Tax=Phtheirospermum japonicum TaxID=374723 RepID=A0A830B1E3_9LAMI|nr:2-oxoglutarate-dependent dioxygenase dao [Phtheirospermum japonicum]
MAEMKATVRALLDLPMEIKQRNKDVIAGSGYVAPSNANPLYEGLGLYDIGSSEAVHDFCSQLQASPLQRGTIVKYSEAVHKVTMDIARKLCQRVQFHTDSGFLTILSDDDTVGGLEMLDEKSGAFVAVDPLPGSLLVNFGDIAKGSKS